MASQYNSFKLLEEEQIQQNPHVAPEIESRLQGNMRFAQMVGNVFELYLPKVMGILVSFIGGNPNTRNTDVGQADSGDAPGGQANVK